MNEFKKYLNQTKTIVFPFGTVEEHGRHLPLNTDSFIIQEALKIVAKRKKFFLAPIVYYGIKGPKSNNSLYKKFDKQSNQERRI